MGFEIFFKDKVTLFNRYYDKQLDKECWFPTLFENVKLEITKGANINESGLSDINTAKLYIQYAELEKEFVEPKEWSKLSEEEKLNTFTIDSASDFFIKGDFTNVEILESRFFENMKNNHSNVFKVSYVDRYNVVLPHFVVGGV